MRTRVEKCPGGLAVIVPEALAAEAGLRDGDPAELELADGTLLVRPSGPATLAELLAGITPENLHSEWADGPDDDDPADELTRRLNEALRDPMATVPWSEIRDRS